MTKQPENLIINREFDVERPKLNLRTVIILKSMANYVLRFISGIQNHIMRRYDSKGISKRWKLLLFLYFRNRITIPLQSWDNLRCYEILDNWERMRFSFFFFFFEWIEEFDTLGQPSKRSQWNIHEGSDKNSLTENSLNRIWVKQWRISYVMAPDRIHQNRVCRVSRTKLKLS